MAGGGRRKPNQNINRNNKKGRRAESIRNSLFVEGGVLSDWSPSHSGRSPNANSNSKSGSKPGNFNQAKARSGSKNAPFKSSGNAFGYNYPSCELQEGTSGHVEELQPIVLENSKESQIVAYLDETPTSRPCNLDLTYDYSSDFVLGESSHKGLGFHGELEAPPGAESSSKQMEGEEQKGFSFDSSYSEKEIDADDTAKFKTGEEMLIAAFSPRKNSAFLSIGGVKLYTQDISDEDDNGESLENESSESSGQGQLVELSQSDDSEDTSDSELDVDEEVAEDYLEGIGGSMNILDTKWLIENDLDDSDEDSSSSGISDETLQKFSGMALQEASRTFGMKKPRSKKKHASSANVWSSDVDDLMFVKDPRTVSAKKKHVSHLPHSWPLEAQRSKNSRNFPGAKKKHRKEMIAVKRRQRMLGRGVDLEKINKKLEQIVLDEVDMFCFQPMHSRDCSQVRRLAAIYRLRSGSQGSGKKSSVTVTRTQHTCMPSASDKLRLEKLIGAGNEDADFAVNEGSITKSASAGRNRMKKSARGSGGGRNGSYANHPVSFVASGVMQSEVDESITVDSKEIGETGENKDATTLSKFGAFEVHTRGFGSKMMAKMGFIEGGGLGKDGQGMAQPIEVIQRPKSLGLGVDFSNIGDDLENKLQSIGKPGRHIQTQSFGAFEKHTKGFGSKMMAKMGFVEGMGLGRDSQGMVNPLVAVRRPKARGLGAKT